MQYVQLWFGTGIGSDIMQNSWLACTTKVSNMHTRTDSQVDSWEVAHDIHEALLMEERSVQKAVLWIIRRERSMHGVFVVMN